MADQDMFGDVQPEDNCGIVGIMHALQALAVATLDSQEKRDSVQGIINNLAERALASNNLTDNQRKGYLDGLSSIGIASASAKRP